jgi:hypothetical protein
MKVGLEAFCHALHEVSRLRRPPWWVSIDLVAARLRLSYEQAVVLADDCALAGLVRHDLSQAVKRGRLATDLPHSVCLAAGGWLLVRKDREA